MKKRQIIALGGGGFSMEPDNPLLDDYILAQSSKSNPKVCFIGTASGDSVDYVSRFYTNFKLKECQPSHLSLFSGLTSDLEKFILAQDVIYVGGGNTRNMLTLWREWGLDKILKKAYIKGIVLSGISAGSICWFEQGLTDSIPNQLSAMDCLGFLKGSNCPHFDEESERQEAFKSKIRSGEMKEGFACDDGVGLHFVNENLEQIIASKDGVFAYQFEMENGKLLEQKLDPVRLGN